MAENDLEILERYFILLLGSKSDPIPSREHLQKELFILSKANPNVANYITFEKHYEGPFSIDIADLLDNPLYYVGAYEYKRNKIFLTSIGRKIYDDLMKKYSENPRFKTLLNMIKMIRQLYDKLSVDELLFLIYITYPDYIEKSDKYEELLLPKKKMDILNGLLEKEIITKERYLELVSSNG